MAILMAGIGSLFAGGGAAAGAATAATATAGVASSGLSLGSLLSGTMTALGVASTVLSGFAEADRANAAAIDAETEQSIETLQGISRRASITQAMVDAIGAQDVAYAASGVDLSTGTAAAARRDAWREADLALTTSTATEQGRIARLSERAANYRRAAKSSKMMGFINGFSQAVGGYSSWRDSFG